MGQEGSELHHYDFYFYNIVNSAQDNDCAGGTKDDSAENNCCACRGYDYGAGCFFLVSNCNRDGAFKHVSKKRYTLLSGVQVQVEVRAFLAMKSDLQCFVLLTDRD